MRPKHGGRLELRLTDGSGATARYVVSILSPDGDASSAVAVDSTNGALELAAWQGTPPPAWLDALVRSLLRTVVRSKLSNGVWPRRITRWRPEPLP